jgi:hypothetical protein|tara:strand:- start:1328 stop:1726 length:399 start_codon:yes stop_codon:yes gene_type:complete
MYNIKEIFDQALVCKNSISEDLPISKNVRSKGVKIQMFSDRIEILDMNRGGDYYRVIDKDHYNLFYKHGWLIGCLKLNIINCLFKLKLIENKIKTEVNTRKNDKHIKNLKNKREVILIRYAYKIKKLNLKLK